MRQADGSSVNAPKACHDPPAGRGDRVRTRYQIGDYMLRTVIDEGATGAVWKAYKYTRLDRMAEDRLSRSVPATAPSLGDAGSHNSMNSPERPKKPKGHHVPEGALVAIKIIPRPRGSTEIAFFKYHCEANLKHENIIQYYSFIQSERNSYFVLELCGDGNLHNLIYPPRHLHNRPPYSTGHRRVHTAAVGPSQLTAFHHPLRHSVDGDFAPEFLSEQIVRAIAKQLASGVAYLHSHSIVHGDIKPKNLLFTTKTDMEGGTSRFQLWANFSRYCEKQPPQEVSRDSLMTRILDGSLVLKVGDFGTARKLRVGCSSRQTYCGTTIYMAPEALSLQPNSLSTMSDMYSIGATIFEMLFNDLPYTEKCPRSQYAAIKSAGNKIHIPKTRPISDSCRDLLSSLLAIDPVNRISAEELLLHPFISDTDHTKPDQEIIHTVSLAVSTSASSLFGGEDDCDEISDSEN